MRPGFLTGTKGDGQTGMSSCFPAGVCSALWLCACTVNSSSGCGRKRQCRFDDSSCQARPKAIAQIMVMAKNAIIAEILSIRAGVRAQDAVKVGAATTQRIERETEKE